MHGLRVIFHLGSCCKSVCLQKERGSMSLGFIYCFHVLRRQRNYSNRGRVLLLSFPGKCSPSRSFPKCRLFLWGRGWKLTMGEHLLRVCAVLAVSPELVSCHSNSGLCSERYCLCVFIMENWNYTSPSRVGRDRTESDPPSKDRGGWPQMRVDVRTLKSAEGGPCHQAP